MKLELHSGTPLYEKVVTALSTRPYTTPHIKWGHDDSWPLVTATVEIEGVQQQYRLTALQEMSFRQDGSTIMTEWYPVDQWPYGRADRRIS